MGLLAGGPDVGAVEAHAGRERAGCEHGGYGSESHHISSKGRISSDNVKLSIPAPGVNGQAVSVNSSKSPAEAPPWPAAGPDLAAVRTRFPRPFEALARGETPALILRGVLPSDDCVAILERIAARRVLRQPAKPGSFHYLGTSLGMLGQDPEAFFADARRTHALFASLFEGLVNPVEAVYQWLNQLAVGHRATVAREPDGRRYGPAIFRYYPPGRGHLPHFDSVRLREKRVGYAVYRYPHQFAGVLCLQAPEPDPEAGEGIIHRVLWSEAIQPRLEAGDFHDYAREQGISQIRIQLQAGDFYVFNTGHIHEVPPVRGSCSRIVLATFLGFDPTEEATPVWS